MRVGRRDDARSELMRAIQAAEAAGEYRRMLDQLGCGPEHILHVSSSYRYDLMTAHDMRFGMRAFVNRGFVATGGWEALALQINYPDFFGGAKVVSDYLLEKDPLFAQLTVPERMVVLRYLELRALAPDEVLIKPDTTTNYELGLRSLWFDGRLLLAHMARLDKLVAEADHAAARDAAESIAGALESEASRD